MQEAATRFDTLARPARTYVIQGRTISLPAEIRDASVMSAVFVVRAAIVRKLIPHPSLSVPELLPGRALCMISAVEHRQSDFGSCSEVSLAFFVRPRPVRSTPFFGLLIACRRGEVGLYAHRLLVTTSLARDVGREIWGLPRSIGEVDFFDDRNQRTCQLRIKGARVLTLSVARFGRRSLPETRQQVYTWQGGIRRTPCLIEGTGVRTRLVGGSVSLGLHPIANVLRRLGLPKPPLMTIWIDRMRARLEAPDMP
jgi:hypothetical protein